MLAINNILGTFFQARRIEKGMTVEQMVLLINPTPTEKQACSLNQRIRNLEDACHARPWLWQQVARILGIDDATYNRLAEEEKTFQREEYRKRTEKWNKWADFPVKPYGILRLMAAFYNRFELPDGITQQDAETLVSEKAKENRLRCCLVWNRRWTIFFAADGSVEERKESTSNENWVPWMAIGGRKCLLREMHREQP